MARVIMLLVLFTASGTAFGQDAHYTYPFTLACPEAVANAGETVTVGISFEGGHTGERYEPTYSWTITQGTIVAGQATKEIQVRLDSVSDGPVYVTMSRQFLRPHFPEVQREATCQIAVAARPLARMTDEFPTRGNNCEEGLARLDAFLAELHNDPGSNGVIALYGDTSAKGAARIRERHLRSYARFRNFDLSRLRFIRGAARESGTTQFWIVPPGADPPSIEPAPIVAEPRPRLPYMHSAKYLDGLPECSPYDYDPTDYARVLNMEPRARARVVLSESSRANFNRGLKEIVSVLKKNGVTERRIIALYRKVRPNRLLESTELWVIRTARAKTN